jgi:hypothetical protein
MITKDIAMKLTHGTILHHVTEKNADGTPVRVRITGQCKTWKTRPNDFRIPWKYGLYCYGYVDQDNCSSFYVPK